MKEMPSVAKKIVISLAGLFLCSFLVVHLGGNLLLFKNDGGAMFNLYSDFMESNIFIKIIEIVLFLGFFVHIVAGIVITIKNKGARPIGYITNNPQSNSSLFSRNMGVTGALLFLFLAIHINSFMIHQRFLHQYASMFESVKIAFANPFYSLFYLIAVPWLGLHLAHGFQSAFQSLGINHSKYTPFIKLFGAVFSIVVTIGFMAMPIYFYLKQLQG